MATKLTDLFKKAVSAITTPTKTTTTPTRTPDTTATRPNPVQTAGKTTATATPVSTAPKVNLQDAQKSYLAGQMSRDEYNKIYKGYKEEQRMQKDSVKQYNSEMQGYANQLTSGQITREQYNALYKQRQDYLSTLAEEYYNPRTGKTEMFKPEDWDSAKASGWVKYGSQEATDAMNQAVANDPSNAQWASEMGITPKYGAVSQYQQPGMGTAGQYGGYNQYGGGGGYGDPRQAMRDYMDSALSPDTYQKIFGQIMQQLNPAFDAQKSEISDYMNEQRRLADVDAERRGLYTSGVGAAMQNELASQEAKAISSALAQLQQQATQLTSQQQSKMLERAAIEGNWTTADMNYALAMLNSDRDYELGQGQLNLGHLNSDRNYEISKGQLGLGQLNSDRDFQLGLGQLGLGQQNSDRDYEINKRQLGLSQQKFEEDKRQFDSRLNEEIRQFDSNAKYRDTAFAEDIRRFDTEMGYKWSSLSASNKATAFNQQMQQAELALRREQWTDQKAYNQLQQQRERMSDAAAAYSMVGSMIQGNATYDQIYTALQPYKDYDFGLYVDLLKTAKDQPRGTAGSASKPGLIGQPNNYNLGASLTPNLWKR